MQKVFKFRLSEELKEKIESHSKKKKINASAVVRDAIEHYLIKDGFKKTEEIENLFLLLKNISLDLSRVPSNLNQIAYNLNTFTTVDNQKIIKTINELTALTYENMALVKSFRDEIKKQKIK